MTKSAGTTDRQLVSWCFEPSQPLGIVSRLKTDFNPSLSYLANKSFNANHNISAAQIKYFTQNPHNIFVESNSISTAQLKYFFTQNLLQHISYFIENTNLFQEVEFFLWIRPCDKARRDKMQQCNQVRKRDKVRLDDKVRK